MRRSEGDAQKCTEKEEGGCANTEEELKSEET